MSDTTVVAPAAGGQSGGPSGVSPLAGQAAPASVLIDPEKLREEYYARKPDLADPAQRVSFGTSGHRGSALRGSFNEFHVLAISQAICDYRKREAIGGPLYIGRDTHAVSEPALRSALEVLAANGVETMIDREDGYTPTPVVSHAILAYNRPRPAQQADGIVITPSHNPPEDGGFKYNPPHGGPADTAVTRWIEERANALLTASLQGVARVPYEAARRAATLHRYDYLDSYVADLGAVVDMQAIASARLNIGVDPLGGASVAYWRPIAERYGLELQVVNATVDPTFRFMTLDWDGKIRMDCSSPYAMARLIALRERFDIAFGNDTDADRHGIVTRTAGLMPPNHYLAVRSSIASRRASVAGCTRCRWDSNGSCRDCSMAHSASAARRAPALPSCGRTARCGPRTRTASSRTSSPRRSRRARDATRHSSTKSSRRSLGHRLSSASTRPPRSRKRRRS